MVERAIVKRHKGPKGPLQHRCSHCSAIGPKLLRCSGCRAVQYCSREHQALDRALHKRDCNAIKRQRDKVAKEDALIRNAEPDFGTPANAFETEVGRFWGFTHTRDYMRARYALADRLRMMGTLDGVREALAHLQDMLRLNRRDNMGLRCIVPALLLRLDRDLECATFIKYWYHQRNGDGGDDDDGGPAALPFELEDVLDKPGWIEEYEDLNHQAAMLLLKLKLLVDLRNLRATNYVPGICRLPMELRLTLQPFMVRSPLAAQLFLHADTAALQDMETKLLTQIRKLAFAVCSQNSYFMADLFHPDRALSTTVESYQFRDWEEGALALQYAYAAWWETDGVLDLLNRAHAMAVRALGGDIKTLIKKRTTRSSEPELLELDVMDEFQGKMCRSLGEAYDQTIFWPRRT